MYKCFTGTVVYLYAYSIKFYNMKFLVKELKNTAYGTHDLSIILKCTTVCISVKKQLILFIIINGQKAL